MNKKQIYFKSDFTVILASEAQWGGCPFRLSFYTASPSRAFVASFDGENWENCRLLDDGRLEVAINQKDGTIQTLMGIGTLMCAPEFYLDNDAFRDHVCNEFVKPFAPVFIDTDGTEYNAVLDLNGSSTLVTIGTIPAFYQRGEKGERGERGEQGIQGATGATGPKGETGPQGQQGIQGIQGPKGETGATGPQGERGLQGEKGEPFRYSDFTPEQLEGLRGPQGVQGETGPAGPVGPQGPQGERGPKGDSVTMFPAVTIFGQPTIQETQMSGFSAENYAQFPFMVDFAGRNWRIDFAITTGADVSQQHNIFDSAFGLAFAFKGGKFLLAMSSNGTSWNLGATSGTHTIAADTTYYIRITWDGTAYVLAYSTDKVAWTTDITVTSSESLAPKQVIIGKSLDSAYVFNGSINFAEARLTIANVIVWEGMEEVGTATRMALDMSNIDEAGKQRVNDIVKSGSFGAEVTALDLKVGELDTDLNGENNDTSFVNTKFYFGENGMSSNAMFKCTNLLPLDANKKYEHIGTGKAGTVHNAAFYSSNKDYLGYKDYSGAHSAIKQVLTIADAPEGTAFVAFNSYVNTENALVEDLTPVLGLIEVVRSIIYKQDKLESYTRKRVNIYSTDSEIEILNKLLEARNAKNCDVVWEFGMYEFTDTLYNELNTIGEFKSVGAFELPLGGGCKYFFNGSTIMSNISAYDGSCNIFGCVRKNCGDYALYDGTLISNNTCYCVHDEGQGADGMYVHEYHNMTMIQNSTSNDLAKCIGGGTGKYGKAVIEGCLFINNNDSCLDDCAWHGVTGANADAVAYFEIVSKNNYFSKRLYCQSLGKNQTAKVFYSGNSSAEPLRVHEEWEEYSFCNEVRS